VRGLVPARGYVLTGGQHLFAGLLGKALDVVLFIPGGGRLAALHSRSFSDMIERRETWHNLFPLNISYSISTIYS